ncbi:PKD domain-containing protein [Pseudozobellia thermophila]|uniref:PKD domain-containing protein n=1 Tax=Pseudozobellia thermophila TaxID=192903 RepID=UPI0014819FAB|nr:PKD domain-containing protein [Pseudozobellia thermophila]
MLKEAVLDPNAQPIAQTPSDTDEEEAEESVKEDSPEEENGEELTEEETKKVPTEIRTTVFAPVQDAYLQDGKGYNNELIRLEENHRDSYLMFDLSQIDSIGGTLEESRLEFTITTDDGDGNTLVYKGNTSSWTEDNLTEATAPRIDSLLGTTSDDYRVGQTKEIDLQKDRLNRGLITLVLKHKDGDDFAFASKEHPTQRGPRLVVTYKAPQDAEAIVGETVEETNETPEEDASGEDTMEEDVPGEEATEEEEEEEEESSDEGTKTSEDNEDEAQTPADPGKNENQAPISKISANKVEGEIPLEIKFNGGNSSDDKEITAYSWDFKDGNKATTVSPSHTFTEEGSYEVSLTVTDEEGLKSTSTLSITATEAKNEAPTAVISGGPFEGYAPLKVEFKAWNSKDDTEIVSYSWNFKDGSTTSTKNPDHTFNDTGSYDVELTVKDEEGLSHTVKQIVKVTEAPTSDSGSGSSGGGSSGGGSNENGGSGSNDEEEDNDNVDTSGGFSELKAFPTAEGFGKNATGGRGGIVVEVTNLNDSGPGSLRYALEEIREPRTIVFKVGGTINAKSNLPIYAGRGNVTIAGQTAPGGGILIRNGSLSIQADNVIVRHLRFRMDSSANPQDGHNMDGIRIRSSNPSVKIKDIIIDHCSVSWALDENISTVIAENVTVQNCVFGESIRAMLISRSKNISILNNLFVLNNSRSVMAGAVEHKDLTFEQINNIVYGFKWATSGTDGMSFNVIANTYKLSNDFQTSTNYPITLTPPAPESASTNKIETTHAYLKDNIMDSRLKNMYRAELEPYLFSYPKNKSSYIATSASQLDSKLLSHVGASVPKRDAVDNRLINHYKNMSGTLKNSGSFPSISSGAAYKDSDKDGMADDWEKTHGLDPNDKKDGNKDRNNDGYTNLEDFLYYLANK